MLVRAFHARLDKSLADPAAEAEALREALRLLSLAVPVPVEHVRFVAAYYVAMLLLQRIDERPSEAAHLGRLLADLPLLAHHRVVALRMAAAQQLAAQNYGVAARLLGVARGQLGAAQEVEEQLAQCRSHREANAQIPADAPAEYTSFAARLRFVSAPPFALVSSKTPSAACCTICHSIALKPEEHCSICFIGRCI